MEIVEFVQSQLQQVADPEKAGPMAAYMKTKMPFYGVQKPQRAPISRQIKKKFAPSSKAEYESNVFALWSLPHQEEKYIALDYACHWKEFIQPENLPMFEWLIRDGSWWDFVDQLATNVMGHLLLNHRKTLEPILEEWIEDEDMWIRRSAILAHNKHKERTNQGLLFRHCLQRAFEEEFFIRKAIGWALREYSKTAPQAIMFFLEAYQDELSGLSVREASKWLTKEGLIQ